MSKASEVVAIALAEVGYKEKASNTALDDKTANAGANNWTKYARDLAAAGYYNGNKNGFAWCDVFVDWCFFKAYGAVEGQRIQCQTGDCGAGCTFSKQYYMAKNRCDRSPKVGDQVFFQQGGTVSHTGLVTEVNGSTFKTVEGNTGDCVACHTYNLSNTYVDSFGHPLYDDTFSAQPSKQSVSPSKTTNSGASANRSYTVTQNDCLWNIAMSLLCNGSRYTEIMKLNGLTSTLIYPGQVLQLPDK